MYFVAIRVKLMADIGYNINQCLLIVESDVGGSFIIYHRWGRVGVQGKQKVEAYSTRNQAIYEFKGKFQKKTNNRWSDRKNFKPYEKNYTWIETDYGETDKETVSFDLQLVCSLALVLGLILCSYLLQGKTEKKGSITDQIKESQLETRTTQFISLICNIGMMKQQMMEIGKLLCSCF
jgi:poly [ADP-ribose] polymerase